MDTEVMDIDTPPEARRVRRPRSVVSNDSTATIKSQSVQKKTVNKTAARKTPAKKKKRAYKRKQEDIGSGDDNENVPEEEYIVEHVLDKEIIEGRAKYLIKWKNWPTESNTWEPLENLTNCPLLIEAFEAKLAKKNAAKKSRKPTTRAELPNYPAGEDEDDAAEIFDVFDDDMEKDIPILFSYPENKELAEIYRITIVDGYLTFLVRWDDKEDVKPDANSDRTLTNESLTMIRAQCLNERLPQRVIDFYERHTHYRTDEDSEVHSAAKAARSLAESRERRYITTKKRQRCEEDQQQRLEKSRYDQEDQEAEDEEPEDPAALAIEAEKNGYGKFDPNESGLSETSSVSDQDEG